MSGQNPAQAFGLVSAATAAAMTGLDLLKRMLEYREPSPPFSETTDIWMVSVEAGRAVFEGMPSARFYNPMEGSGALAAGVIASAFGDEEAID